jgi:hypothetical protein
MVMEFAYNDILENVQVNNIILAAAGDGVISGLDVSERGAGVNMSVDVAAGSALIGGTTYTESSVVNLVISAADATHARKDLVIYDVATTNPLVVTGTPATPPIPPDITAGDILLAIVNVAANETEITNGEITDCIVEVETSGALGGLSNVVITSVADNELLAYDSGSSTWINQTPVEAALAALAGFTMAGDINMGDYQINNVDDLRAFDTSGIKILGSAGTARIYLGDSSFSFKANGTASMGTYRLSSVGDPSSAQDAATKAWCEANFGSGSGDMTKAVYDPNADGVIAVAQTEADVTANNAPQAHNQSATTITSGTLTVARGGTGVTSSSSVADVNATKVDGCDAGVAIGDVYKVQSAYSLGTVLYYSAAGLTARGPSTDGYQLTTHGVPSTPTWAAASDLLFSDTHCPKCGKEFQDGDNLILHVIGHNEVGDILTIPMHLSCANEPKKTVMVKRKVMEDHYVLDEMTGDLKVQRVQKMTKKTVTKHKLKEGYIIDSVTGKAHTVDDKGERGDAMSRMSDAIEEIETTIEEAVYENTEFEL